MKRQTGGRDLAARRTRKIRPVYLQHFSSNVTKTTMTGDQQQRPDNEPIDATDPAIVARYEPYLRMLARTQARRAYQAKVGASDIVQQAMMQAVQGLDGFRGATEAEFRGWLRKILAHHLCHLDRDMHRDKRDIRREQSMEQNLLTILS